MSVIQSYTQPYVQYERGVHDAVEQEQRVDVDGQRVRAEERDLEGRPHRLQNSGAKQNH
jgi:hypothetical protein